MKNTIILRIVSILSVLLCVLLLSEGLVARVPVYASAEYRVLLSTVMRTSQGPACLPVFFSTAPPQSVAGTGFAYGIQGDA